MNLKNLSLYHGSLVPVEEPDPLYPEGGRGDFGKGFYTTTSRMRAVFRGYMKMQQIDDGDHFYVTKYRLSNVDGLNVQIFDRPDEKWLDAVMKGREGKPLPYDMVVGPVADSRVYEAIDAYRDELDHLQEIFSEKEYEKEKDRLSKEIIEELVPKSFEDYDQEVFITRKAAEKLRFAGWTRYDKNKLPTKHREFDRDGKMADRPATQTEREKFRAELAAGRQKVFGKGLGT